MVVVENDAGRAGLDVCRSLPGDYPWSVHCVMEPQPGICFARNRAVREALAQQPDFIANLDDDEWPAEHWLEELHRIQASSGADAVGGPVVPVFPENAMEWEHLRAHYGAEPDLADGTACELYAGGNFLARSRCFEAFMPAPFDPAFNTLGGEDLYFFKRLSQRGLAMAWAARATAFEDVPASRMTHEWLLRRHRRRGQVNIMVQRKIDPSPASEAVRAAKTASVFVRASIGRFITRLTGSANPDAEFDLMYGLGRLDAHFRRLDHANTFVHGGPS